MLKGLKGILEKGLQIAAPFIGNMILPGGFGSAIGSGIASLITGNKPKDALMAAGAGFLGGKFLGDNPLAKTTQGKTFTISQRLPNMDGFKSNLHFFGDKPRGNSLIDLASKAF